MVDLAIRKFGKPDMIFNNGRIYEWYSVEKTPSVIWDRIAINQRCAFLGTKYSAPRLKKTEGVIVNTSSSLGVAGPPESSGVLRLQKHHNWPHSGFCPSPGSIDTSMQAREFSRTGNPTKMRRAYNEIYPLGRIGMREEVAKLVVFLASKTSSFCERLRDPDKGCVAA